VLNLTENHAKIFKFKSLFSIVIYMGIKAIYENNVLKPLEKLALKEGEEVEIEVKKNSVNKLVGIIKISNKKWIDEIIESPDLEPI